ncbi:MAG: EamA family transporter, partial [Rhodospirillales bacterium]|nr:EamA family transporter [Rhodospirillales bacterium]
MSAARAAWAAAGSGVLVGAAMVASRHAIDQTTPAALALLRYVVGVLCLLPMVAAIPRTRFAPGDIVPVALLGIVQFGVLIALLNWG